MGVINKLISEHNKMSIMRRTRRAAAVESSPTTIIICNYQANYN